MDLAQSINLLKGVPDQALQHELVQPSGLVPSYLVLAEAQRRQLLRQQAQKAQGQPSGSVYDDVIRNMSARQPPQGPPPPPGMTPVSNAPPSGALGSTPPQNFQAPRGMAEGGEVDDGSDDAPAGDDWEPIIQKAAQDNNLDPALIRAVIKRESSGNPKAVSPKGALGPMQLMPGTAKQLGVTDPTDPAQAIPAGARLLRQHMDKYGGDLDKTLAAYNAGEGAVDQYGGVPPYQETKKYIKAIRRNLDAQQSSFLGAGRPDLLPQGPMTIGDPAASTVQTAQDQPTLPPAPGLPAPDTSGLGALFATAGPAPPTAAAAAPAQAPAPATFHQPTMEDMVAQARKLYGPPPDDPALRAELARLQQQAHQLRGRPSIWETLAAFGSGMASSTSPFWGQALGAGGGAMLKMQQQRQEQARQLELATMGISEKLDDKAQQYQKGLAEIGIKAQGQYEQHQLAAYNTAIKVPGAVAGKQGDQALHPGWEFVAHPYADIGAWVPPGSRQVTPEIQPFLPYNEVTGKPYQVGEPVSYAAATAAETAARQAKLAQVKQRPTVTATRLATAVDQLYNNHPELPRPTNADGSPKDPRDYTMGDAPAQFQGEVNYNNQLLSGTMNKAKAEAIMADAHASIEQHQLAQNFLDQDAKHTGALAGARIAATNEAYAQILTPGDLDLMSELLVNGKPVPARNPFVMAQINKDAARKLRERGMTAQAALMDQNAAKASQAALMDITKLSTNAEAFSKTAENSMKILEGQAKLVSDLGAPIFNTPLRDLQSRWTGNTNVAGFRAALLPVQSEIARVLQSPNATGGVLSDSSRHEMQLAIGDDATYDQIHRALDVFRADMAGKREVYSSQMEDLKPKTVVGGTQPPAATRTATDPKTGRKIVSKDGGKTWTWQDTGEKVQ